MVYVYVLCMWLVWVLHMYKVLIIMYRCAMYMQDINICTCRLHVYELLISHKYMWVCVHEVLYIT